MADIEELIERLEFLRCQPNSKRSNDAVDDALETAAAALSAQQREIAELREALGKARDKFREYEGLHTLKLRDYKGKEPLNYAAEIQFKINRNREMADMCDGALNTPSQEGEKQ